MNGEPVGSGSASPNILMAFGRVNTIEVAVTSLDGSDRKTYRITVVRAYSKNTNGNKKALTQAESVTSGSIKILPTNFIPADVAVSPDHDTLGL